MARASMERQVNGAMKGRSIFRDEKGSTTAGMAVALLVTLSLLFSAAQVYRIHAAGSEVQEVADAAACAALNPVAEFMVAVRVADAAVLSLTLLGDIAYGAGVVALCVPPAAELGSQLVSAGQKVLKARDALSQKACEGLGALQRALPFLAAANGAAVAAANGEGSGYAAMALLLPGEGSSIASGASAVEESMEEAVEAGKGELAEAASRAEEAARAAEEARARGFARDCGDNPSYCMYERAGRLAGLSGADNPLFASVDSWSFSVPLERARVYYRERLLSERPASDSAEEQARSALRKRFYAYAISELREAFVHETADSFSASFPRFPRNTGHAAVHRARLPGDRRWRAAGDACLGRLPGGGARGLLRVGRGVGVRLLRNLPCLQVHSERLRVGGLGLHLHRQWVRVPLRRRRPGCCRLPEGESGC